MHESRAMAAVNVRPGCRCKADREPIPGPLLSQVLVTRLLR